MVEQNHYRWDFIGLSTDTKPTPADSEKVTNGSTYYTSDDSKLYVWYKDQWYEKEVEGGGGGGTSYTAGDGIDITGSTISVDTDTIQEKLTAGTNITITDNVISAASGGGVKTLTTDDYNFKFPSGEPDGIAPWLLDEGMYVKPKDVYMYSDKYTRELGPSQVGIYVINKANNSIGARGCVIYSSGAPSQTRIITDVQENGDTIRNIMLPRVVVNNLTSTSTDQALSAYQGKVLKDLIDGLIISGAGAPTTSTVGTVGQIYEDTTNGKLYQCTAVSGNTYTWTEVGAGGGVKVLTAADYNYPSGNPTSLAIWLLDEGQYITSGTLVISFTNSENNTTSDIWGFEVLKKPTSATQRGCYITSNGNSKYIYSAIDTNGGNATKSNLTTTIVQSTGTSTTSVMSQNAVTQALANVGGFHVLSAADINWEDADGGGTNNAIALWLLPSGNYYLPTAETMNTPVYAMATEEDSGNDGLSLTDYRNYDILIAVDGDASYINIRGTDLFEAFSGDNTSILKSIFVDKRTSVGQIVSQI